MTPLIARNTWIGAAILATLVVVVYWPTLDNGFITDDGIYVKGPQNFPALAGWSGLRNMWFHLGVTPQYYPLVHSVMWVEYQAWGLDPRGYHAMNMLWHAAVALLLWRLLARLQVPGAWLAAAIFAVHPVQVESVAWASERKNLMSAALALGSMLAYLRFQPIGFAEAPRPADRSPGRSWAYWALALLLYLGALLSKTVVASVPAVLLVIIWWKRGRLGRRDLVPLVPFFVVGLGMGMLSVWMERTYVGATGADWRLSAVERLLIAGRAVWFYAGKLAWPHPLTFLYPRWTIDSGAWWQYLFPAAALALLWGLWLSRKSIGRGPLAAALVFGGVLSPALGFFNVFPFVFSFVADHYQYHASMALIALAASFGALAVERLGSRGRWIAVLLAGSLLLLLAGLARQKTYAYKDEETLFRDAVALSPTAWAAHYDLACTLLYEDRYAEALEEFQQAQQFFAGLPRITLGKANTLAAMGQLDLAAQEYRTALSGELDKDDRALALIKLADVLSRLRRYDEALETCQTALQLKPTVADGLATYGEALRGQGKLVAALEILREWVRQEPDSAKARHALGRTFSEAGQHSQAILQLAVAVRLAPQVAGLHEELAAAYLGDGRLLQAEKQLQQAIRLDPENSNTHDLLGVVQGKSGDFAAAIAQFEEALRINPMNESAASNLRNAQEARRQSSGK